MVIAAHPFGSEIDKQQLLALFIPLQHWEERFRTLIQLSKRLPPLKDELKCAENELSNCENRVWLDYQVLEDGKLHFYGDSEGRIVKGLLAILLTEIEGKTANELINMQLTVLFQQLGIWQQLSSSRKNGLTSLMNKVLDIAKRHA